jgi:hypothetical protein
MPNLKKLLVEGNMLRTIPHEVIEKGTKSLLDHLKKRMANSETSSSFSPLSPYFLTTISSSSSSGEGSPSGNEPGASKSDGQSRRTKKNSQKQTTIALTPSLFSSFLFCG